MIIHAFDGSRIACALLSDGVSATLSASAFVPYFSYTSGSLAVGGSVSPMSTSGTTQTFAYSLSGVDPACSSGAGTDANSCGSRQPRVDPCDGGLASAAAAAAAAGAAAAAAERPRAGCAVCPQSTSTAA